MRDSGVVPLPLSEFDIGSFSGCLAINRLHHSGVGGSIVNKFLLAKFRLKNFMLTKLRFISFL